MAEGICYTPRKTIQRVCVSPASKEQICLLCTKEITNKDFKRKLTISGGQKKTKVCLNLELIAGKEIGEGSLLTNTLCRNCADKNETLVRKILEVRESLESSRKTIEAKKGGTTSVKRLARAEDSGGESEETRSNKRALFVACDDRTSTASALRSRDVCTQVDFGDFYEEESPLTEVSQEKNYRYIRGFYANRRNRKLNSMYTRWSISYLIRVT